MPLEVSFLDNPKVVVNAGLWLDAPDIDAIAWLNHGEVKVSEFNPAIFGERFALASGTWSPFNSQNTMIKRKAIPAYFLNPAQKRYDDIWASYIVTKIAEHLGDMITFGEPVVTQVRNPHNYMNDLRNEMDGMERTPALIKELRAIKLTGSTYEDCTCEVMDELSAKFLDLKLGYHNWLSALDVI